MSAPFAPHPHPAFWVILLCCGVTMAAIPFGRQPGIVGALALTAMSLGALVLWGVLLYGVGRKASAWWRDRRGDLDN